MVVTVNSSCSSPDFRAHIEHSTSGSYRIPRKPPPAIDISERYPSPDPADPFAPLWVLRNRTSSNLMLGASRADASQDTLDNTFERKYIVYPTPPSTSTSNPGINGRGLGGRRNSYRTSPPASPSPTKGYNSKSNPGAKMAHYKTYSQLNDGRAKFGGLNTVGTLQAFPRIMSPSFAQSPPHIDLASPKVEQRPWSPNIPTSREASASPQSRIDPVNFADSTWSSDSNDDDEDDEPGEEVVENASVNPLDECKPSAYIPRNHHQSARSASVPIGRTEDSRSRSSSASPRSMKGSTPKTLAKFLFPRKMSVLNEPNVGSGRVILGSGAGGPQIGVRDNLASRGLTGRRTTASTSLDYRHVTKSSISAPQPFALPNLVPGMGICEPSANNLPIRGRVDTSYKNGLDLDGSLGQKTTNDASHDKTQMGIEKIPKEISISSANGVSLSRALVGTSDSPPPIKQLNDKPDSRKAGHDDLGQYSADKGNGMRCLATSRILDMTASKRDDNTGIDDCAQQLKKRPRFPMLRSLSVPLPGNFSEHRLLQHNCKFGLTNLRSRMSSGPQLLSPSSLEPSMHSISNTSIVNISISGPTFAPNVSVTNGDELEAAFASPRRAPLPPSASPQPTDVKASPAEKSDDHHTEKSGSTSYNSSVNQSSRAASPAVCSSSGCSKLDVPIAPLRRPASPPIQTIPTSSTSLPTEWALPTQSQIIQAASLQVVKEDGKRVTFGSLFSNTRTIVVFIRHFWCPLCQDYMSSLKSIVKPEMLSTWPSQNGGDSEDLKKRLVSFVVIGNGAYGMIHKYKQMFGLPFEVYTDPAMAVYKVLGMGKDGGEDYHIQQYHRPQQPQQQKNHHHQPSLHVRQPSSIVGHETISSPMPLSNRKEKCKSALVKRANDNKSGGYIKHGLMSGIAMVVVRALKVGMPVWEKGGDINQLGGEFIFGPGHTCSFAHRMQNTKGHTPIEDVLKTAGINVNNAATAEIEKPSRTRAPTPMQLPKISLIPPTPPPKDYPPRRRLSSLRTLKEVLTHSRAASPINPVRGGGKASFNLINEATDDEVNPANALSATRKVRRFSTLGVLVGMMSQEEEEKWMEHRQKSLDMLKEKKNKRRGLFSKAQSVQSIKAEVFDTDSKFDDIEESNVVGGADRTDTPFVGNGAWDGASQTREIYGRQNDHRLRPQPTSAARHVVYRRSFDSATDSASAYSIPSDNLDMAKGSYIFREDDGLADDEAEPGM